MMAINILCKIEGQFSTEPVNVSRRASFCVKNHSEKVLNTCSEVGQFCETVV